MKSISFYNTRGEIHSSMQGDESALQLTIENSPDPWIEGSFHWDTHYVNNGVAVPRPECPATLSGSTLYNVPVPAQVIINQSVYDTTEETVELSFNLPGTYVVKVISWPHLPKEFTVENPTS